MAGGTRSGRSQKDEDTDNTRTADGKLKTKVMKSSSTGGAAAAAAASESANLRRSTRGTPVKKMTVSNPSSHKPERRETQISPTSSDKRSERDEKKSSPSPLRRSGRIEKNGISSSPGSKKSSNSPGSQGTKKRKKEAKDGSPGASGTDKQSKDNEAETHSDDLPKKRKRLDARSFTAFLMPEMKQTKSSGKKHQKEDTSRYDSVNSGANDPNETQNDEDDCHWRKAQKLKLSDHCEDLVEGSNSVSRKLLTLGNDERSKKRKICSAEAYGSKDASNSSVSIYSDNSSQLSPVIATDKENHDTTVERVVDGEDDKIVSYSLGSEELREAEIVAPNGKEKTPALYGPSSRENSKNLASEHEATLLDKDIRETSIAHITSSSPQETEKSTLCCKLQRVHNESQASETCSFNSEIKYHLPVSSPKEGRNPVASFEDNCKGAAVVSSLKDDIRPEARGKSAGAISQNCSITSPHTTAPTGEDRGRQMAQDGTGNSGEYLSSAEPFREIQNHTGQNACLLCKKPGLLLCCDGKDCKRSYHLSCLDPPLKDIPMGVWLCLFCVKKKMESGVYSVSEGMESVLDVKEGIQNGNHYLVKYKGLAHVHDRWVPESQIILEAPTLLSKFNRRHQKEKVTWWKQEWTEPHRLLSKRLLMPFKVADEYFSGHSNNNSDCYHEWLVKWKGLGYEHATWEFETAPFLCSSQGISLIKDYESRREEAKKASDPSRADKALQVKKNPFQKLPRLPDRFSSGSDNDYLSSINRLREFWHKSQNAIFVDEQERIIKLVLFILTVQFDTCRPFLIISTVSSLSVWESEFARLAPAINLVIYSGNRDVRKMIRNVEFFVEGSCIMFQVLLSHTDAIAEDFEVLDSIGWEAVIVDECQNSRVSKHLEKLKHLSTDFRLLLLSGQLKDSIAEYLNLLSFLDSRDKENSIANHIYSKDTVGALSILKEKLAHYLAYERKEDSSKFAEYWVPVRLSNVQLEQYCAALLSNSSALRSNSKIDHVGALRDILMSARKCCDHPYIVDPSLQSTLTKDLPPGDYLDIGVNASGKLLLLDKILQEIKNQGIRVLILFQSIGGAGRNSIGDILDDFLRQRFGADSYERVDSGLITSKKLAALNMFNDKARGRFVFLIENRACLPSIKLSSVDAAIIFDSDWNLLNDLRALQRISIESQFEQVKVFRLYSSCTVEEKVLIFAKQDMILESKQNINPSVSHSLLGWGAGYLFKKLDEFHQNNKVNNFSGTSSDKAFLNDVVLEVLSKLPNKTEGSDTGHSSILIKAQHSGVSYSRNIILVGEKENISLPDKDPPSFWSKLLEGRNPQWRYISQSSQRIRRKVQSLDEPAKLLEVENDEGNLKRKKVGSAITDPTYLQSKRKEALICKDAMVPDNFPPSCGSGQLSPTSTKKMLIFPNSVSYDSEESPNYANVGSESMPRSPYDVNHVESERRGKLCNTQRSLHLLLKPELSKLCETLRLPEDIKSLAETLLEYVLNNHHVSREPETILQAFLLSLCWRAASLLKHTMDRKESLVLAKQYLKYECDEEQAYSVYVKLRILKKRFSRKRGPVQDDSELSYPENQSFASTKDIPAEPLSCHTSNVRSYTPVLEGDRARERDDGPRCIDDLVEEEHVNVSVPLSKIHEKIRPVKEELQKKRIILIEKVCLKREEELNLKHQAELSDFNIQREAEKMKLKNNYDSQLGVTRTIILDPAVRNCKIRLLNQDFSKKMAAFDQHMKFQRRKLALKQADARNKERQIKGRWMEEAKTGKLAELFDDIPLSDSGFMLEGFMVSEKACEENVMISSVPSLDHLCQDVNPIGRTDSSESVMEFLEIPASIPNEVVNKLPVVTEPLDSQCDNMNTRETIKPIGTSTEIPATVFPGVMCGMTVGTESPETHLAGVTTNMLSRKDEIVVIETEAPASQCNNINEIESTEPTETPLENPVAVLPGMAGDLAMETVSSYSPSDTMSAEENREMHSSSIMAKVAAIEQNGFMDASGPCATISLQTRSEFCSAGNNASAGCTSENSESTNQHQVLSGNEIERPDVSDSIASDQAPPPVLVPVLNSVDSIPAQGEPDKLNQSGTDSLQQMTLPTDILLVEHSQGITPGAPIASEEPSNQEDIPNHQPEVTMQQSIVDAPVHVGRSDQMASRCDVNPLSLSITAAGGTFSEDICSGYQIDRSTNQSQELMQKQVLGTYLLVEQGNQVVSDDVYSLHPPTTTPERTCTGDLNSPYIQTTGQTVLAQLPTLSSDLQVEQSDQSISHDVDASSIQGTCSGIFSSTCHQTQCSASTSQTESLMQQPTVATAVQVDQSYQISQSVVHPLPLSVPVPPERAQSGDLNSTIVQSDFGNRVLHNFATNWIPPQGLHPDPLQNELAKIRRQNDLCIKMQEDKKLRLKLECDLEIEKVRRKYDALLQDAETEFLRDKRVIDTIYKKVMMNQVLAEQFRARFIENKGGASSSLQGSRSSHVPQFLHASQPQLAQRPASVAPSISFPIPATLPPVVVSVPAPPSSSLASTRIWPPASVVSSISAAQMGCHTSPVAFSSNPVRPHFSPTFPARATLQLGSEPRAPAPHLHRFRPHASVSPQNRLLQMGGTTTLQQHLANAATASSGRPSLIVPYPPRSPSMAPGGQEMLLRGHSLPVDLPLDVGDSHVGGDTTNMATEATAAFETWFMSNLSPASIEVPSNNSAMRTVATSDVVCISDDDN